LCIMFNFCFSYCGNKLNFQRDDFCYSFVYCYSIRQYSSLTPISLKPSGKFSSFIGTIKFRDGGSEGTAYLIIYDIINCTLTNFDEMLLRCCERRGYIRASEID